MTAKTKKGEIISLGQKYERIYLQQLRKKEEFYCIQCNEKVILKLGTKRINHFAHERGAACPDQHDPESEYHMVGKMQLFKWLKQKGYTPVLEPYYEKIKQRADISFRHEGKIYCVEFQCSTISEEIFKKRTAGYKKLSLHPIWILAGKRINRKNHQKVSLTSFEYLFLRKTSTYQWYIPSYCPYTNQFILLANIIPISARNAYTNFQIIPLEKLHLNDILNPQKMSNPSPNEWRKDMEYVKRTIMLNRSVLQAPFLKELYSHSINPQLMPPFVGLPINFTPVIQESPFIWQTYIFIDHLYGQSIGKEISINAVFISLLKRIRNKQLRIRHLPNISESLLPLAVTEYLLLLERVDVLKRLDQKTFKLCKQVEEINNIEEGKKEEGQFYNKYSRFLFQS